MALPEIFYWLASLKISTLELLLLTQIYDAVKKNPSSIFSPLLLLSAYVVWGIVGNRGNLYLLFETRTVHVDLNRKGSGSMRHDPNESSDINWIRTYSIKSERILHLLPTFTCGI